MIPWLKCMIGLHEFGTWIGEQEIQVDGPVYKLVPMPYELCFCKRCGYTLGRLKGAEGKGGLF